MKRLSIVVLLWSVSTLSWGSSVPPDLGQRLVQEYVAPATAGLARAAHALHAELQGWCGNRLPAGTQAVRARFGDVVRAWSGVEFLRFGPLVADNRYERFFFWPDPRGVTLRQVQALLAGDDPVPVAGELVARSVAVQGLPALEYALFGDKGLLRAPDGPLAGRACAYAVAVAANLARLADELAREWSDEAPHGQAFAHPSERSPAYRSTREVAAEAIKALSTGLQFTRDVKIAPALGGPGQDPQPRRAPFWRSGLSAPSMEAAMAGMLRFYEAAGYRYDNADRGVDETVRHELDQARRTLAELDAPVEQSLAGETGRRQWTLVRLLVGNAKNVIDQNIAPALGVTMGFNALDGD